MNKQLQRLKEPHFQQEKRFSCGAASYRKALNSLGINITEEQARKECKTKSTGTKMDNVYQALLKRNIPAYFININEDWEYYNRWLELNTSNRIIIVGGVYRSRYFNKGRDRIRHHAMCTMDGIIFDPAIDIQLDFPSYRSQFNKNYFIDEIIMISLDEFNH